MYVDLELVLIIEHPTVRTPGLLLTTLAVSVNVHMSAHAMLSPHLDSIFFAIVSPYAFGKNITSHSTFSKLEVILKKVYNNKIVM